MYSLIGSLVVMRDREAGTLTGTFMYMLGFKYEQFRHQRACAVQKQFARVSVTRTIITHAPPLKCDSVTHIKRLHVHDDPTNGPTGDPGMVRLP